MEKLKSYLLKLNPETGGDAHEAQTEEVEEEGKDEVEVDKEKDKASQETAQEGARAHLKPGGSMSFSFEELSLEFRASPGKVLVFADPHIGFELSRGLRVRTGFEENLSAFVKGKDPDLLIILGDVKEPLGLSFELKEMLLRFFSNLRDINIVITKGNHDGRIEEVTGKFSNVTVVDYFLLDDRLFIHGHRRLPDTEFSEVFLGHAHSAYIIRSGGVSRKVKVFARLGQFLVFPTINPFIEGFDVREGLRLVPFLRSFPEADIFLPDGLYLGKVLLRV
jgi:metallophosphoesterase superfamily enzyme